MCPEKVVHDLQQPPSRNIRFNMSPPPVTALSFKELQRTLKRISYLIGLPEDKKFLEGLRYYYINCICLALGVKNALETQKAKPAFS